MGQEVERHHHHHKKCCHFNLTIPITLEGECCMPQTVQVAINFNIQPPAPPALVANPTSANDSLTVGQPAPPTPLSQISGGTPPYQQPVVDPSSPNPLPPGLSASIDDSGNLIVSGTPVAAGSGSVTLVISDSGV